MISLLGLSSAMKVGFCSITNLLQAFFKYGSNLLIKDIYLRELGLRMYKRVENRKEKKPQVFFRNGLLEEIVEEHDVMEVDEHGGGFAGFHCFDLRLVIRLNRIPKSKADSFIHDPFHSTHRNKRNQFVLVTIIIIIVIKQKYLRRRRTNLLRKSRKIVSTRTAFSSSK